MFNNVNNTQREVRNGLTFPSCCFAFLSRRLLNELSAQICSASSLPNEHSAQRLSAQWTLCSTNSLLRSAQRTLCSTNSLLSEHSAQQALWPLALKFESTPLLFLALLELSLGRHGGLCAGNRVTLSSLSSCQAVIKSPWHPVILVSCHPVLLSSCHMSPCHPCHPVKLSSSHPGILSS